MSLKKTALNGLTILSLTLLASSASWAAEDFSAKEQVAPLLTRISKASNYDARVQLSLTAYGYKPSQEALLKTVQMFKPSSSVQPMISLLTFLSLEKDGYQHYGMPSSDQSLRLTQFLVGHELKEMAHANRQLRTITQEAVKSDITSVYDLLAEAQNLDKLWLKQTMDTLADTLTGFRQRIVGKKGYNEEIAEQERILKNINKLSISEDEEMVKKKAAIKATIQKATDDKTALELRIKDIVRDLDAMQDVFMNTKEDKEKLKLAIGKLATAVDRFQKDVSQLSESDVLASLEIVAKDGTIEIGRENEFKIGKHIKKDAQSTFAIDPDMLELSTWMYGDYIPYAVPTVKAFESGGPFTTGAVAGSDTAASRSR